MGLRPHDFETGSSRRVTLQPYVSRRRRLPLLPRERFSPWAESGRAALVEWGAHADERGLNLAWPNPFLAALSQSSEALGLACVSGP